MGSIVALIIITVLSLLVVRISSHALVMTGLSVDTARFQAVSAFFGVGFTTREAELVVNHPVRRRIIRDLIVVGNIGLTSALATVVVSFVAHENKLDRVLLKLSALVVALFLFWVLWKIRFFRTSVDWVILRSIERIGVVKALDYEVLLRAQHGYGVAECVLEPGHPLVGKTLAEVKLRNQGVVVLGIARVGLNDEPGVYIGAPHGEAMLLAGDVLTVYGRDADVRRGLHLPPDPNAPVHPPAHPATPAHA
jgi:hypothetical protein